MGKTILTIEAKYDPFSQLTELWIEDIEYDKPEVGVTRNLQVSYIRCQSDLLPLKIKENPKNNLKYILSKLIQVGPQYKI